MRKLTQKDDIQALLIEGRLYMIHNAKLVDVTRVVYIPGTDRWRITGNGGCVRTVNSDGLSSWLCVEDEAPTPIWTDGETAMWSDFESSMKSAIQGVNTAIQSCILEICAAFEHDEQNKIFEQITNKTIQMKTQKIELKEGMTCVVKGGKVIIETPEWKPTDGEFVTLNERWVSVYAGEGESPTTISDYCGTWLHWACFVDEKSATDRAVYKIRKSTPAEVQKFHALLEKSGKRWNPDTKKVEDLEWKPKAGDVVTTISPRGKTISIYKSGNIGVGCAWDFYASMHYADGFCVEEQMMDCFWDGKIRLSTYEERCTFFARLVAEGYKWNAKKLKLTKKSDEFGFEPENGDFYFAKAGDISGVSCIAIADGNKTKNIGITMFHAACNTDGGALKYNTPSCGCGLPDRQRRATQSEIRILLDALAKAGKRWNAELKRVEDIKQKVVEMTMEQVCEKLGMNVKIIKK